MPPCRMLGKCRFLETMEFLPKTREYFANNYCEKHNRICARYAVSLAGVKPPDDLFPNEEDRTAKILHDQKDGT